MLVLASASLRRQDLLHSAGISFTVQAADVDETPLPGESSLACALRLAREKALTVWRQRPTDLVLGADTIVVVDNLILGKPSDRDDAARMLRLLSGRSHDVITGVCLVDPRGPTHGTQAHNRHDDPAIQTTAETTRVTFIDLSEEEIAAYIATKEPMDKAGAYAIQGIASRWIPRIEGDYSNVVGLPVALVYRMLRGKDARKG